MNGAANTDTAVMKTLDGFSVSKLEVWEDKAIEQEHVGLSDLDCVQNQ
jgi:hypothetical protein